MDRTRRAALGVLALLAACGACTLGTRKAARERHAATAVSAASARAGIAAGHPFFRSLHPPLVIAHRGGAALWPENTLEAFRRAVALGVDVLEMDVHASADGELVVIHDPTVDRTTDGGGTVGALTVAALKQLDAGYRWSSDGRTFPYRGRGITIPTLAEVLVDLPAAHLVVEIKPEAEMHAPSVCRIITAAGAEARVLVASFDADALARFRAACPAVATSASPNEAGRFVTMAALPLVRPSLSVAVALLLPDRWHGLPVVTPRVVRAAHARGLPVQVWTIDDAAAMRRFLTMGVDGIVTDRPDRLLALLGRPPQS